MVGVLTIARAEMAKTAAIGNFSPTQIAIQNRKDATRLFHIVPTWGFTEASLGRKALAGTIGADICK